MQECASVVQEGECGFSPDISSFSSAKRKKRHENGIDLFEAEIVTQELFHSRLELDAAVPLGRLDAIKLHSVKLSSIEDRKRLVTRDRHLESRATSYCCTLVRDSRILENGDYTAALHYSSIHSQSRASGLHPSSAIFANWSCSVAL